MSDAPHYEAGAAADPSRGVESIPERETDDRSSAESDEGDNVSIPLGVPMSPAEWRELKRRADEPGNDSAGQGDEPAG